VLPSKDTTGLNKAGPEEGPIEVLRKPHAYGTKSVSRTASVHGDSTSTKIYQARRMMRQERAGLDMQCTSNTHALRLIFLLSTLR